MILIEKMALISNTITKLINYSNNIDFNEAFDDYLKKKENEDKGNELTAEQYFFQFIFDRNTVNKRQNVIDVFLEREGNNLSIDEKSVLEALCNNFLGVFLVNKITKTGFETYSLVNEKEINIFPLVKMTTFRGIVPKQFIEARIFKFEEDYFLIEITNEFSSIEKEIAYVNAIADLLEAPDLIYFDNPEKLNQIKTSISIQYEKFLKLFSKESIIASSKKIDEIIKYFEKYILDDLTDVDKDYLSSLIGYEKELKFVKIPELNEIKNNIFGNLDTNYSLHVETYDIGLIFNKELGLFIVPFYETFNQIFKADKTSEIEGYKECIENFLNNMNIPRKLAQDILSSHRNALEVINNALETNYETIDILLDEYKPNTKNDVFSVTTILFNSTTFSEFLKEINKEERVEEENLHSTQLGRNDLCPCGSGLKYKKCCLNKDNK